MKRWIYYVVIYHFNRNEYDRYLLTAPDISAAQVEVLTSSGPGWRAHHSEMVCSTTDAAFCKRL